MRRRCAFVWQPSLLFTCKLGLRRLRVCAVYALTARWALLAKSVQGRKYDGVRSARRKGHVAWSVCEAGGRSCNNGLSIWWVWCLWCVERRGGSCPQTILAVTCGTGNKDSSNWPTAVWEMCVGLNRGSARMVTGARRLSTDKALHGLAPGLPWLESNRIVWMFAWRRETPKRRHAHGFSSI